MGGLPWRYLLLLRGLYQRKPCPANGLLALFDMPGQTDRLTYEQQLSAQPVRPLHAWERGLLKALAVAANLPADLISDTALAAYRVRDMLGGGMGSIRFVTEEGGRRGARFSVAEIAYQDIDGMPVSFALNLDDHGEPWEIDSFTADNSALRQPPVFGGLLSQRSCRAGLRGRVR